MADPGQWNKYAYAGGDPVNFNDPSGLDVQCPPGGICIWYSGDPLADIIMLAFGGGSGWARPQRPLPLDPPTRPECNRKSPLNAQKLDWIAAHRDDAAKVARELGVTTADILGLSALESAWGKGPFVVDDLNNFFSQHAPAPLEDGTTTNEDGTVTMATFASYADSAESFSQQYGYLIKNISSPRDFAAALQNAGKYGINKNGSKVATFVGDVAGTINGLAKRMDCDN